jgi:hypothetical protein
LSKRWFWVRALLTLILVGLVAVGGYSLYRTGWSQGYVAAQLAEEGEEGVTVSPSFARPGWPYGFAPYRPFGGVGLLFGVVLALLFFGLIGKLIGFIIWGPAFRYAMAGKWPRYWHHYYRRRPHLHGHPPGGPVPPWDWGWEEEPKEEDTAAEAEN